MWIFLLSDTFVFSCFLISYMTARMSTTVPWPNPSEVFALTIGGTTLPLILIAIMTFVLISSSGTMAMAVNFGYRRDRRKTAILMLVTALLGATFVGMQAFEWTKLIHEGVRPWANPWGAAQFGSSLLHDHGLSRHPCEHRRDLPSHRCAQGLARRLRSAKGEASSPAGRGTTKRSRSWASTGTSSISSGSSSSRSSIFGERHGHGTGIRTCSGTAASDQALSGGLGLAVHPERLLVLRRLFPAPGVPPVFPHPPVHDAEGGPHRRRVHAHGLGTAVAGLCHPGARSAPSWSSWRSWCSRRITRFSPVAFFGSGS